MNPEGLAKLAAHVDGLLDLQLSLISRHELLQPIMRDAALIAKLASGSANVGFELLRHTLYWNLIQEIVKISADMSSKHVPSVQSVMTTISPKPTLQLLRDQYVRAHQSNWPVDESANFERQFDEIYARASAATSKLLSSATLPAYKTVRDELLAHYQLNPVSGKYEPTQIAPLNMKYGDERELIVLINTIVADLNSLGRVFKMVEPA